MHLHAIDRVDIICPDKFKADYYTPKKPLIITGLAKQWPGFKK